MRPEQDVATGDDALPLACFCAGGAEDAAVKRAIALLHISCRSVLASASKLRWRTCCSPETCAACAQMVDPDGGAAHTPVVTPFKIVNVASGRRIWARKGDFETHGNYEVRAFGACAPEQHVFPTSCGGSRSSARACS